MSLAPGTRLGQYEIQGPLGTGGMGEVYLAKDAALGRLVAVKTLKEGHAHDGALLERFRREARAVSKLNHPNIVQIYVVDADSDPPYMAIQYIDGAPLDRILREHGALPWQRALNICGQVAAALACAHDNGIIHRDIKPANILIDKSWGAHVSDFGIARVLDAQAKLTSVDTVVGSPSYMSPEQCGAGEVVPGSDLFSLGVTLFESMSRELPFKAETTLGVMRKITTEPAPPLTNFITGVPEVIPAFLETLMTTALERRYSKASQVLEDLQAISEDRSPPHLTTLRGQAIVSVGGTATPSTTKQSVLDAGKGQALVSDLLDGQEVDFGASKLTQSRAWLWPVIAATAIVAALIIVALALGIQGSDAPSPAPTAGGVIPPPRPQPGGDLSPEERGVMDKLRQPNLNPQERERLLEEHRRLNGIRRQSGTRALPLPPGVDPPRRPPPPSGGQDRRPPPPGGGPDRRPPPRR